MEFQDCFYHLSSAHREEFMLAYSSASGIVSARVQPLDAMQGIMLKLILTKKAGFIEINNKEDFFKRIHDAI